MTTLSKHTAMDIALAWREIETAETLLREIEETRARYDTPDIRDAFGRPQSGLQLGVPSGSSSTRLFDVPWEMCGPIIRAHISRKRALIESLSAQARIELEEKAP